MKSNEFLQAAIDVQKERGAQYDKPSGERSMGATVAAFNCITGHNLKEQDGWMLQGLLKLVRQSQNPEKYQHDSALDFVAYASLYAEAASEQCKPVQESTDYGWIEWKGGCCPVTEGTLIDIKDGDGELHLGVEALSHFSNYETHWQHHCVEECQIIAYRILPKN